MNIKHRARYINRSPYIRLLADKPAVMYNFSFLTYSKEIMKL